MFVGSGTVILPGVTIGSDVVIGAGSVVTRDIPAQTVAAGNPCRRVRDLKVWLDERTEDPTVLNVPIERLPVTVAVRGKLALAIQELYGPESRVRPRV